jgi:hypothetical protein
LPRSNISRLLPLIMTAIEKMMSTHLRWTYNPRRGGLGENA